MSAVAVLDSGVANVASMSAALRRLGCAVEVTRDPARVARSEYVVLPGVGAFGAGMASLRRSGLDAVLREAVAADRPLLAVCLGLQLLCEGSDESPEVEGLGVIGGRCRRLPEEPTLPQLGWNGVRPDPGCRLLDEGDRAFANSYALLELPVGWSGAWSQHGVPFLAALERGRTLACQFHPELSGGEGLELIRRWLEGEPAPRLERRSSRSLTRRIIPCLDVRDGRVVKGIQFQGLRDAGDPAERAALYEVQGADEIVILDVAASHRNEQNRLETTRRVRERLNIPLTVGGGMREVEDGRLFLEAGADKVSVNTAAVRRPELLGQMARAFGRQCVVLAIDARRQGDGWEVLVMGGRESVGRDAVQWARQGVEEGAGEILLTSWDRDGTRQGCDTELLAAVSSRVSVPVIASGGIGSERDVAEALRAGADAVLAASIFHDDEHTVAELKEHLADEGFEVRR